MKKKNKKIKTLVHVILDKSGSMNSVLDSTISGFNEYLITLKKSKSDINFSLTLFDTVSIETPYTNVPVKNIEPLNKNTYRPAGGTPLYDAVVESVEALNKKIGKKKMPIAVVIMTDGEENASKQHDEKCLRELVDKLQKKGNWTFAYMGANQDAWANAAKYGISSGSVLAYASTDIGTMSAFRSLGGSSVNYAASMSLNADTGKELKTDNFFNNGTGGGKNDSQS